MEREINSQGEIIEKLINKYLVNYCVVMDVPLNVSRIVIIASGSSYNAGVFGKYFFENISNTPCCTEYASEVISSNFTEYDQNALYIFLSQSGMSVDTLEAAHKIKNSGAKVLCITNDATSQMHQLADYKFDIEAGKEEAIAATKTYSATVVMLWLIALKIAQNKHIDIVDETRDIYSIKNVINSSKDSIDNIDLAAKTLSKFKGFAICGLGANYALALEAALKIKETSYINTSVYPMGEFVHGHFALLNETKAFLTFVTQGASKYELKTLNKILKTYKSKSVIISDTYEDYDCDILVKFQKTHSKIASIINMIVAIQLLALKIAKRLNRDVDKPIGLVKVVNSKG